MSHVDYQKGANMRHLLNSKLKKEEIENILNLAENLPEKKLSGKILATLFYEPSTRTRLSFESAMIRLGGNVISVENGKDSSSDKKGESLKDTLLTVSQYADVIAIRHSNSLQDISCPIPIINAGDGSGEHPTQALLDLYTIKQYKGTLENLTIMISGDLLYSRTVHSLLGFLKNYNVKILLDEPETLPLPEEYYNENTERINNRNAYLKDVDILYVTRPQKERWGVNNKWLHERDVKDLYIDKKCLELLNPNAGIMHPLPRTDELPEFVDKDPRCLIWKQVKNGVLIRMAVLLKSLEIAP